MVSAWFAAATAGLYLYAGHQTWWRMLVTDPQAQSCSISIAVREHTLPFWIYGAFVLLWLPLLVLGWTTTKV